MPRLLALIPEDGWAMVREAETIFFVRPPFRRSDCVPVPNTTLADAISVHGYEAQPNAPEESWADAIDRIRDLMTRVRERESLPTSEELLVRMLRSGPESVLTGLLNTIEDTWLARGELRAANHALKVLLAEERVKSAKPLLDRALALHDRIDDLRAQREARAPRRTPPSRIEAISRLPRIVDYKSQFRGLGSAAMVSTRP